jgi:hypothetical protein
MMSILLSSHDTLAVWLSKTVLFAQETSETSAAAANQPGPLFWICYSAVILLIIAAQWKIFAKAGQPGWASIVPIYNIIVWCKIVGRPAWWVLLLMLCFPVFYIIITIDLAKSFGKGVGFAMGLIFLSPIFFPILGFGSDQYVGPSAGGGAAA